MGSLLSLHLQATRNRCTGFTSPVTHLQSSPDPSLHEDAVAGLWFRLWILCLHFLKIHSLLWLKVRGVTNLISVRELTLTDFQQQWGWRHFEGYLHKKKDWQLTLEKTKSVISNFFLDTTDGWVITMHCIALLSWCRTTVSSTEGKRLWEFTSDRGLWLNYCVHGSSLQAFHSLQLSSSSLGQKSRISC